MKHDFEKSLQKLSPFYLIMFPMVTWFSKRYLWQLGKLYIWMIWSQENMNCCNCFNLKYRPIAVENIFEIILHVLRYLRKKVRNFVFSIFFNVLYLFLSEFSIFFNYGFQRWDLRIPLTATEKYASKSTQCRNLKVESYMLIIGVQKINSVIKQFVQLISYS